MSDFELSSEPLSTEIGSGGVESAAFNESGLEPAIDGDQADEFASELEDAIEDGATDEEIQEMIETFKIKVNGKEKDVQLDWNNKEDIIRRLQMAEAAPMAMQRAAELEKNFERSLRDIADDPWSVLAELGLDPDELAEQRIQQRIAELQKTPDQIAQEARDKELEELRQKLKAQEEEKESIEFARLQQEAEQDLDNSITEALSSTTSLPKSPYVVKRIADAMLTAMQNGRDDVTPKDVIPWVEKEINEEMQGLFTAMPDKLLEQYLGNKTIDRLRQNRLSKMKTQPIGGIRETGKNNPVESKAKKNIKLNDWLKHGRSITDLD